MPDELIPGTVIRVDARVSHVDIGDEVLLCSIRGRLFEDMADETRPLAVGDRVTIRRERDQGVVEARLPRKTRLVRKAAHTGRTQVIAANIDFAVVAAATKDPPLRLGLIDRMLVACERAGAEPLIVINKIDRIKKPERVDELFEPYSELGYQWLKTSTVSGEGIDSLRERLHGHVTIMLGHSGVGKSSLLNAIQPGLSLKVGHVSERRGTGRHTTTHVSLLKLALGGYVIDTPGVREFGVAGIEPLDLSLYFPEIDAIRSACHYPNCLHKDEPDCAVWDAVDDGRIDAGRFQSYRRILDGLSGGGERAPRHDSY